MKKRQHRRMPSRTGAANVGHKKMLMRIACLLSGMAALFAFLSNIQYLWVTTTTMMMMVDDTQDDEIAHTNNMTSHHDNKNNNNKNNTQAYWDDKWQRWRKHHPKMRVEFNPTLGSHVKQLRLPLVPSSSSSFLDKQQQYDMTIDRYGKYLLPPRLKLPDNLRLELSSGVLMSCTGSLKFAHAQLLPAIEYFRNSLQIPNANERSRLRKRMNDNSSKTTTTTTTPAAQYGFALVTTQRVIDDEILHDSVLSFFDVVWTPDDLPDYPPGSQWHEYSYLQKPKAVKIVKVHAMASAPFDYTVMMDMDTIPQTANFMEPLLQKMRIVPIRMDDDDDDDDDDGVATADIALTNKWTAWMDVFPPHYHHHWLGEHNSALVVLNMKSYRTRLFLGLYIQSFHSNPKHKDYYPLAFQSNSSISQRDQPSLMAALMAAAKLSGPEYSNDMIQEEIGGGGLEWGALRHVDLPFDMFCRAKTTPWEFPLRSCLFAHKARCGESVPAVDKNGCLLQNATFRDGRDSWVEYV